MPKKIKIEFFLVQFHLYNKDTHLMNEKQKEFGPLFGLIFSQQKRYEEEQGREARKKEERKEKGEGVN